MSILKGGIFSKPSGKTGGIVFGAARTRTGKLVTARELVPPSNPNTSLQQTQRSKFKSSLDLVRRIGASFYRTAWNRSVGQLPGFQSMESIFLNQMDASKNITLVNDINLGILHSPDTQSLDSPAAGKVQFNYSTDLGANGTDDDLATVILFAKDDANRQLQNGVATIQLDARVDASTQIIGLISGATYEAYTYFKGVGTAAGLYSVAKHSEILVS